MQPKAAGILCLNLRCRMLKQGCLLQFESKLSAEAARRLFEALLSRTRFAQTLGSITIQSRRFEHIYEII